MTPIKWFWNWKAPKNSKWVPYALIIVCIAAMIAIFFLKN